LQLAQALLYRGAMRNHIVLPTLLIATLFAGAASAQTTYVARNYNGFPGKDELSGQLGFQASLGGGTPGGFKMFFDYSHRLSNLVWLNFKLNPTFGAGETRADVGWFAAHVLFGFVLAGEVAALEAPEGLVEKSGLDWVIVRVNRLVDEVGTGLRAADDRSIKGMRTVARANVAAFMLEQLTSDVWLRRKPVLQSA